MPSQVGLRSERRTPRVSPKRRAPRSQRALHSQQVRHSQRALRSWAPWCPARTPARRQPTPQLRQTRKPVPSDSFSLVETVASVWIIAVTRSLRARPPATGRPNFTLSAVRGKNLLCHARGRCPRRLAGGFGQTPRLRDSGRAASPRLTGQRAASHIQPIFQWSCHLESTGVTLEFSAAAQIESRAGTFLETRGSPAGGSQRGISRRRPARAPWPPPRVTLPTKR